MDPLSVIADVLSILGFILTLWVAWNVKQLRRRYTLVGVAPVWIDRIREQAERIKQLHGQYNDSREDISVELSRLAGTSEALERLLPRDQRRSIHAMVVTIRRYEGGSRTAQALWEIYRQSQRVLEELKSFQEEQQWPK